MNIYFPTAGQQKTTSPTTIISSSVVVRPDARAAAPAGVITDDIHTGAAQSAVGGTQNQTSSWLGRSVSWIKEQMTFDNVMQISLASGIAFGLYLAGDGNNNEESLEGISFAIASSSLNCLIWGFGCLAKKEEKKAIKRLGLGTLMLAITAKFIPIPSWRIKSEYSEDIQLGSLKAQKENTLGKIRDRINSQQKHTRLINAAHEDEQVCYTSLERCKGNLEGIVSKSFMERLSEVWSSSSSSTSYPAVNGEISQFISPNRHIVFGTTYIAGNKERDHLSQLVDRTHRIYSIKWNLEHQAITESLLKDECEISNYGVARSVDCVPYWNKIAVILNWLKETNRNSDKEEWRVMVDDDMPVTNMKVDPYKAIDLLRKGKDTSVIVARDVQVWNGDSQTAVNTGLLFVRKDAASLKLFTAIWNKRNTGGTGMSHCRTLGTCQNQDTLHEQTAMAEVLKEDRSLIGTVVSVVMPRDKYETVEIAINTFERSGCFVRDQKGWGSEEISYSSGDRNYPEGAWRVGDWMGQTAGVPIFGWYCNDKRMGAAAGHIRQEKLEAMIGKTIE